MDFPVVMSWVYFSGQGPVSRHLQFSSHGLQYSLCFLLSSLFYSLCPWISHLGLGDHIFSCLFLSCSKRNFQAVLILQFLLLIFVENSSFQDPLDLLFVTPVSFSEVVLRLLLTSGIPGGGAQQTTSSPQPHPSPCSVCLWLFSSRKVSPLDMSVDCSTGHSTHRVSRGESGPMYPQLQLLYPWPRDIV